MPLPQGFSFCIQYYRQPTPTPAEWEDDLKHIKSLGFNAIQLRPQWAWHEPSEGKLRWDDTDRLFDLAEKNGLKVLFKFILESAPMWLFTDYDVERIGPDGIPVKPFARGAFYLGGWSPSFENPIVREKGAPFIEEGVKRYRERENLLGWHIWNEPRSRPFRDNADKYANEQYREWLKERYGSLENFNETFGLAISRWKDIVPPPDLSAYYDTWLWRIWRAHSVAERMDWVASLVRKNDSTKPVFCHVGFQSVLQPTLIDTCHDWLTAKTVDVYGTSFPHWTGDFHTFANVDRPALFTNPDYREEMFLYSLQTRWIGAVKDFFFVNEVYGNAWNYQAEDYTGDDTKFMLLTPISEGARGIVIWQFKPERFNEESITSGLIELDGSDTPRSQSAALVGHAQERYPEEFDSYRPEPAEVAIVFDFEADMYSEIEDAETLERVGTVSYRYKESLKGYYSLFWQLGLPVDFIPVEDMAARLERYKVVALPYLHMVDETMAAALKKYVENGGTLICDPGFAFRDRRGWVQPCRPGFGLHEVIGAKEIRLKARNKEEVVKVCDLNLPITRMRGLLELVSPTAQDLSDGNGLMVRNEYGSGTVYTFGFYPGLSYRDTSGRNYLKLIYEILEKCELNFKAKMTEQNKLVRVRRGSVGRDTKRPAAFVFNYEDTAQPLPLECLDAGVYKCLLSGREVDTSIEAELEPREVLFLVSK